MPRLKPPPNQALAFEPVEELPTEDVVIEIPDDDVIVPTEIELAPEKKDEPKPKVEVAAEDNPLQKALDAQQRAEELQRTAQRERDEAVRQTREREEELTRERGERQDAEYNSVLTAIAAETASIEKAETDYAGFAAAGDWANAGKAQRVMATAAARLDKLEDGKQAFESKRETVKTEKPAPQAQGFEQRIAALPETAKTWLRKHPEYINDTTLNAKIGNTHNYLIDNKGIEPFSTAYFDALDTEFGFKAASTQQRNETETNKPKPRSIPMSAPVSREVPTASGERATSKTMTLTPEEIRVARNSFGPVNGVLMSNRDKELLYARNKAKLLKLRANGVYRQTTEQNG